MLQFSIGLVAISLIIFLVFVVFNIIWKKEIPESISAIVWNFYDHMYLWTIWIWSVALTLIVPMIEIAKDTSWSYVSFLTIAFLSFVAAMPLEKNSKNTMHYVYGSLATIFSQIYVALISPWSLLFLAGNILTYFCKSKWVFVLEMTCILDVYFSTLQTLFKMI